jgi:glycine cleavage system H protein
MEFPKELKYTKTHEWVRMHGEIAVVGITDFAQNELTDVVYIELPEVGKDVNAGADCAVVESVKAAVDIYSPLSGKIVKVNRQLFGEPQLLNSDPYGEGWVFEIEPSDLAQLDALMDAEQYRKMAEEQ